MISELLKAIVAVIGAIGLAVFAKRYSDMKKRDVESKIKEVLDEKKQVVDANNDTSLNDLVMRENNKFRNGKFRQRGDS